jgi:hypothetical protein
MEGGKRKARSSGCQQHSQDAAQHSGISTGRSGNTQPHPLAWSMQPAARGRGTVTHAQRLLVVWRRAAVRLRLTKACWRANSCCSGAG